MFERPSQSAFRSLTLRLSANETFYDTGANIVWRDTNRQVRVSRVQIPSRRLMTIGSSPLVVSEQSAEGTATLSPAVDAVADQWRRQSGWFTCRDRQDVARFLDDHPGIRHMLPLVRTMIFRHFGDDAIIQMEVVRDPSAPSDEQDRSLLAAICTSLDPKSAEARLTNLDREWMRFDLPWEPDFTIDVQYC